MTTKTDARFSLKVFALALTLAAAALLQGCQTTNPRQLALNQVATTLGSHKMIIAPVGRLGSRTKYAATETGKDGLSVHVFRVNDSQVTIKNGELTVNNKSYGRVKENDSISFLYGKVFVSEKEVGEGGTIVASN
ncbi:MAG: hypothetical protein M3371_08585 [Acidobacteriota bacterium]|nr:hypothetical protein [Acidobacteriota bacterium]